MDKYDEIWGGIKNKTEASNGDKKFVYNKKFMKIKFDSDDDLPLNKLLKIPSMTIVVRSGFEEDGKYYPYVFLDEWLYEV